MRQLSPLEKQRGELLAQFLNSDMDEYGKIGELVEWCQELHSLYVKRPPLSQSPERLAYERQRGTLQTRVNNQVLYKFTATPRLDVSEQGLAIGWVSRQPFSPAMEQAIGPYSAVYIVLEMTTAGTVNRIRRCENPDCGKWMMVTSTKRLTCSDDCRFAKYQNQKGSRANDMRKSRKLHKDHPQLKKQKGK